MIRKINTKKGHLEKTEQAMVIGGTDCPISCGCNSNCGDYEAHNLSSDNSMLDERP